MKKNDIIGEIITEKKDIEKNGCYTVARVKNKKYCVELHFDDGILTIETGIKNGECWDDFVDFVDWDIEKMSNDEILKKMYKIFIETF